MDIKRDGHEIYSNLPCNIQINKSDNADPDAVDVVPIITSLTINMDIWLDVRNDDYITAKRMSHDGEILEVYVGKCGYPATWQGRKSVDMAMATLKSPSEVTPPPPKNQSIVLIKCQNLLGQNIQPVLRKIAELGKKFTYYPPVIDGYSLKNTYLDGILQAENFIDIQTLENESYDVKFEYEETSENSYLRILHYGVYTEDDGSIEYGNHLYKKIPIEKISGSNGNYTITTKVNKVLHEDNGELKLDKGTKIKLFSSNEWAMITTNATQTLDGYEFNTEPYTPTQAEENAYVCNWYEE